MVLLKEEEKTVKLLQDQSDLNLIVSNNLEIVLFAVDCIQIDIF